MVYTLNDNDNKTSLYDIHHLRCSGPLWSRSKITGRCIIELRNQFNIGSPRRSSTYIILLYNTIDYNRIPIYNNIMYIHDNGFLSCAHIHTHTHTHMYILYIIYKYLFFIVAIRVEPVSVIVLCLSEQGKNTHRRRRNRNSNRCERAPVN